MEKKKIELLAFIVLIISVIALLISDAKFNGEYNTIITFILAVALTISGVLRLKNK